MELILDAERDFKNSLDTAKKEGLAEGIEKGFTKGKTEGRVEEKKDIARNLKQIGLDVSKIAQVTGLSIEEIEQL